MRLEGGDKSPPPRNTSHRGITPRNDLVSSVEQVDVEVVLQPFLQGGGVHAADVSGGGQRLGDAGGPPPAMTTSASKRAGRSSDSSIEPPCFSIRDYNYSIIVFVHVWSIKIFIYFIEEMISICIPQANHRLAVRLI